MKKLLILIIIPFILSCEKEPVKRIVVHDDFLGIWQVVESNQEYFNPVGWTRLNTHYYRDTVFKTRLEFVDELQKHCYVRRSVFRYTKALTKLPGLEEIIDTVTYFGHSRIYVWHYGNDVLYMRSSRTGTHYFDVEYIDEILRFIDRDKGSFILIKRYE